MTTLTETMVDIADCHTTLYYLKGTQPPATAPLSLGSEQDYEALHNVLSDTLPQPYSEIRPGHESVIVNTISPSYSDNKYWRRYTGDESFPYSGHDAWKRLLPLRASLKSRVKFVDSSGSFNFKVSPLPSVLVYPFGWSTWLSLRLTGAHTLEELSRFVQYIFSHKPFQLEAPATGSPPAEFSVRDYFSHVAQGIRADIFGGSDTKDSSTEDLILATTVLAKKGGSPALAALSQAEQGHLLRIVKPEGPPPAKAFQTYVRQLIVNRQFEFVILNDFARFIWIEHLLTPNDELRRTGQAHAWLGCHHNNTVRSLSTALHLHQLIRAADSNRKKLSAPLIELLEAASARLQSPGYKNASLRLFLESSDVADSIKKVGSISAQTP